MRPFPSAGMIRIRLSGFVLRSNWTTPNGAASKAHSGTRVNDAEERDAGYGMRDAGYGGIRDAMIRAKD